MTTVTHAAAITGSDNPALQVSKDEWNVGHTVDDDLKVAVLDLSSAQILALFSTPVQVVPAPGAGLFINVVTATWRLDYGTVAYSSGGNMQLAYGSYATSVRGFAVGYVGTADTFGQSTIITTAYTGTVENTALVVAIQVSDPTNGNGTIRITVRYTIEAWV